MDSHKEPMNGAADGNIGSGASSGFAWTHPAFARAVNLPKVANFFFFLVKKKDTVLRGKSFIDYTEKKNYD